MAPRDVAEIEPDLERSYAIEALYRTYYVAMVRTARLLTGSRAEGEEVARGIACSWGSSGRPPPHR